MLSRAEKQREYFQLKAIMAMEKTDKIVKNRTLNSRRVDNAFRTHTNMLTLTHI